MEETGRNGAEMERTLVWGHRGASGYAPENTMAAFEKAVEMGADGIELDVQLTKDGELVVIHDETIDRVSDGSGWVKDYTYAKLIKHNFNRTHPEYEHAQIPTLEETPMRKKNLERIKIPVLIFIAGNDHTSKAGVIVIASMFVIGFVIFKIRSQTMQRREKRSLAVSRTRDEFEAKTENDYDDYDYDYALLMEKQLKEQIEAPMVRLSYAYAMDVVQAKLKMINADLTEQFGRQVIRTMTGRIKQTDSIAKKLMRKGREVTFQAAVDTLNDIAGIRVVCFFCDDIYRVADYVKKQKDITLLKEKDYVKNPKKSGYQSIHLIVGVPVTYLEKTKEIRVEIQIRSFAMDYWAELDNQMCYKKNAGQIENVERATKDYSDVIAKVDNQMLELRRQIEKK